MVFSVVLAAGLIVVNTQSSSGSLETSQTRTVEDSADRVGRQVGSQQPGRQIMSPSLSSEPATSGNSGSDPEVLAEVAAATEQASDSDEGVSSSGETVDLAAPVTTIASESAGSPSPQPATTTSVSPPTTSRTQSPTTTTAAPSGPTPTTRATTTTQTPRTTTTTTTTAAAPVVNGRWSVAQVIDGTIGAGDGSNPNEESPMGRHDAPLYLPQGWNWAQGTTRNSQWGNLRSNQFTEFRCAVIPENGHNPSVPFRVNVRSGAYYQFANGEWNKAFDVALDSPANGGYLGQAGQLNSDPFSSGGHGRIDWRQEADGSFSAPWNSAALMMHFWAGERQSPASGQTAEFLTSEMRLQQPDGQTVDLSQVRVLFQCGLDYYDSTGGQGTRVPGPGIAKYHRLTASWNPSLWVTLPGNVTAGSVGDFRNWLEANLPPDVRP